MTLTELVDVDVIVPDIECDGEIVAVAIWDNEGTEVEVPYNELLLDSEGSAE